MKKPTCLFFLFLSFHFLHAEPNEDLWQAATTGNVNMLHQAIENGASLTSLNPQGHSALHLAALYGHVDAIKALLEKSDTVNQTNSEDRIALHLAAFQGHIQVVDQLLKYGANPNAKDKKGHTPLDSAVFGCMYFAQDWMLFKKIELASQTIEAYSVVLSLIRSNGYEDSINLGLYRYNIYASQALSLSKNSPEYKINDL